MLAEKFQPDLVIFGGSFDPPHAGHQACVEAALTLFPRAALWVLPAYRPAAAHGRMKEPAASFQQRCEMAALAFAAYLAPKGQLEVKPLEAELSQPNYTLYTLERIAAQEPTKRLCFVLGEDQWEDFAAWHQPHKILQLSSLLVVRRYEPDKAGQSLAGVLAKGLTRLAIPWQETKHRPYQFYLKSYGNCVWGQEREAIPLASQELRRQLALGVQGPLPGLAAEVWAYIERYELYRSPDNT